VGIFSKIYWCVSVCSKIFLVTSFKFKFHTRYRWNFYFFFIITTLLIPLCIFTSWNSVNKNIKEFLIAFLVLDFFLIGTFCVLDLLLFYIFFESVLIPMFLIIGVWGSRERKILAAYYFFLYTLLGSVLMLLSILYIYYHVGTTDYEVLLTFVFFTN
jgi:NADH-quinone oxidoreductase subunit M